MVWRNNVQRKAQFPQAYHCSISSSMLPEIDGVMGKASDWKAINYFFAVEGDITIRSVGWLGPQAELSSTCFYDRRRGVGVLGGVFGTGLATVVVLVMLHSHSLPATLTSAFLYPPSFHQACVSLSLFLLFGSNSELPLTSILSNKYIWLNYITIPNKIWLDHCYFLCIYIFERNMSVLLGWSLEYLQLQGITGLNFICLIDSGPVKNNTACLPYSSLVSHSPEL